MNFPFEWDKTKHRAGDVWCRGFSAGQLPRLSHCLFKSGENAEKTIFQFRLLSIWWPNCACDRSQIQMVTILNFFHRKLQRRCLFSVDFSNVKAVQSICYKYHSTIYIFRHKYTTCEYANDRGPFFWWMLAGPSLPLILDVICGTYFCFQQTLSFQTETQKREQKTTTMFKQVTKRMFVCVITETKRIFLLKFDCAVDQMALNYNIHVCISSSSKQTCHVFLRSFFTR